MNRKGDGTSSAVQEMANDGRSWLSLGVVTKVEQHESWGWLLTVIERPSGRLTQARPMFPLSGVGGSVVAAPSVNDEVVLFYPGGNANRAIALAGFPRPFPSAVQQGGAEFRVDANATVEAVLKAETFQGDFDGFLDALDVFVNALSVAGNIGAVAAAATAFKSVLAALPLRTALPAATYSADALRTE